MIGQGTVHVSNAQYEAILAAIAIFAHIRDGDRHRSYDRERILDYYNELNGLAEKVEHSR